MIAKDIQRFNVRQHRIIDVLLKNTEAVAHYAVVLIHTHEDWATFVRQQLLQFFYGILSAHFEYIRSAIVMHKVNL